MAPSCRHRAWITPCTDQAPMSRRQAIVAVLEPALAPARRGQLVAHRVPQRSARPAEGVVLPEDVPVDLEGAARRAPVHGAAHEAVEAAAAVADGPLVGHRVGEEPAEAAVGGVVLADGAAHLVGAGERVPGDDPGLERGDRCRRWAPRPRVRPGDREPIRRDRGPGNAARSGWRRVPAGTATCGWRWRCRCGSSACTPGPTPTAACTGSPDIRPASRRRSRGGTGRTGRRCSTRAGCRRCWGRCGTGSRTRPGSTARRLQSTM